MVGELIYSCKVLSIRELRSYLAALTLLTSVKQNDEIRFGLYRVNQSVYVMIFYFDTPYPPSGRIAWLRSHLTQKFFSFFLTQSVKNVYFSFVLHIYSNTFVCDLSRLFTL